MLKWFIRNCIWCNSTKISTRFLNNNVDVWPNCTHYCVCVVVVATHYSCSAVLPNECPSMSTTGSVHREGDRSLDKDLQQFGRSSLVAQSLFRAPPHFDVIRGGLW